MNLSSADITLFRVERAGVTHLHFVHHPTGVCVAGMVPWGASYLATRDALYRALAEKVQQRE